MRIQRKSLVSSTTPNINTCWQAKHHAHTFFHSYTASQTWQHITTLTVTRRWQLAVEPGTSLYRRLTKLVTDVCSVAITETTAAAIADICNLLPDVVTLPHTMPGIHRSSPSTWPLIQAAVPSPRILKSTVTEVSSSVFRPHGAILVLLKDIWCYRPVTAAYSWTTVQQLWRTYVSN